MKISTILVLLRHPKLALRIIKRRLRLPSYYRHYGFVRKSAPLAYCQSLPAASRHCGYKLVHPQHKAHYNLPQNVASQAALSKTVPERLGFSFFDVPTLNVSETFVGCIPDCKIVCCANEWGRESYSILGADNCVIQIKGTEFSSEHRRIIRSARQERRIPEATWVLSRFYGAYFRWFTQVLPHIILAFEQGYGNTILYPPDNNFKPFMQESLSMIGVCPEGHRISLDTPLTICGKLYIIESDSFCGPLLRKVRNRLAKDLFAKTPSRRIYISRKNARWRRCANEKETWDFLKDAGFDRYCMEYLKFSEQVALMSEASVIIGLHGAGLANMMFCQEGTHVIEIVDPGRPNPHYYALSSCLDHKYWYLEGKPVDAEADPVYRDLFVEISELEVVLKSVGFQLA